MGGEKSGSRSRARATADRLQLAPEPPERVDGGGAHLGVGAVTLHARDPHLHGAVALVRAHRHQAGGLAHDGVARVHAALGQELLRAQAAHLLVGGEGQRQRRPGGPRPGHRGHGGGQEGLGVGRAAPVDPAVAHLAGQGLLPVVVVGHAVGVAHQRQPAGRIRAAPAHQVGLLHAGGVDPGRAPRLEPGSPDLALEQVQHRQVGPGGGRVDGDQRLQERDQIHDRSLREAAFGRRFPAPQAPPGPARGEIARRSDGIRPGVRGAGRPCGRRRDGSAARPRTHTGPRERPGALRRARGRLRAGRTPADRAL